MTTAGPEFYSTALDVFSAVEATDWRAQARPNQLPPPGDWSIWLLLAGRGFGKTRTINEFVRGEVEAKRAGNIAIVGATASDTRDILVTGPAGLLAIAPLWAKPEYQPSKRRVVWPNGAVGLLFSADEPDRLRGGNHDLAICDELAAWTYPEAFDMLLLGLRIGKRPRVAIATTPRPTKIIRELLARDGADVAVTRGSTLENSANLAPSFVDQIIDRYKGTRLERQEIFGEVLEDTPGALWSRENLERTRVAEAPAMQRIVVAIDPAGSTEEGADETGIIVAGLGADGHGYVLDDLSGRFEPTEWARRAISAFTVWKADRIVVEQNYGGAMCEATIAAVDASVPVKLINSSRGKVLRAEPIAAFFAQKRAHMVGSHPLLEDQACRFTSDWLRSRDGSPDRIDAAVFALSELMLGIPLGGFFSESGLLINGEPVEMPFGHVGRIYAAVGAPDKNESSAVGVAYFGVSEGDRRAKPLPLLLLDWEQATVPESLDPQWLERIAARAATLADEQRWRLMGRPHLILESATPVGAALHTTAARMNLGAVNASASAALATNFPIRASHAARIVGEGRVKVTRAPHEKISNFKGVTRNHLMAQVMSYKPDTEAPDEQELLRAFCLGIVAREVGHARAIHSHHMYR